jgi:ATP/maltotriose-dependent transcriptional regulator MalT
MIHVFQGETDLAMAELNQALELARRGGWVARVPVVLSAMGDAHQINGDLDQARLYYHEAIRIANELGTAWAALISEYRLLLCDLLEGDAADTAARMERIVSRAQETQMAAFTRVKPIVTLWVQALSGEAVAVARNVSQSPPQSPMNSPDYCLFLESIARLCEADARQDSAARATAATIFGVAEKTWKRCGNAVRTTTCRDRREALQGLSARS